MLLPLIIKLYPFGTLNFHCGPILHMFSVVMLSPRTCKHCHFCLLLLFCLTPTSHFQISSSSWTSFLSPNLAFMAPTVFFFLPFIVLLNSKICFDFKVYLNFSIFLWWNVILFCCVSIMLIKLKPMLYILFSQNIDVSMVVWSFSCISLVSEFIVVRKALPHQFI